MIKAVIFDMYETLITLFESPLYFGTQMAKDADIPVEEFQKLWRPTEDDRTIGKVTLGQVLESILNEHNCYQENLLQSIVEKRVASKEDCFLHLNPEILPMLCQLQEKGIKIGLISNCFSEEAYVIKKSILYPYFDSTCLSYELGMKKPDPTIFFKCMDDLSVKAEECLYIGDGGSYELETARSLGMQARQAAWYLKEGTSQPTGRKQEFHPLDHPLDVLNYLSTEES